MGEYIPPCDTYTDEDFEFVWTIEGIEEGTGDIIYWVTENIRCADCFQREECVAQVMMLLAKEYGVWKWKIQLEWDKTIYN